MLTKEGIDALRDRLAALKEAAAEYFAKAEPVKADDMKTHEEYWAVDELLEPCRRSYGPRSRDLASTSPERLGVHR